MLVNQEFKNSPSQPHFVNSFIEQNETLLDTHGYECDFDTDKHSDYSEEAYKRPLK